MNWEVVVVVVEVIGMVAIIASLFYVGIQIRQNTAIARANIINATNSESVRLLEMVAQDAQLADIYDKGCSGISLTGTDLVRFIMLTEMHLTWLEDVDMQSELGLFFPEKELEDMVEFNKGETLAFFSTPEVREWWAENKSYYRPGFAEKVTTQIESLRVSVQ